MKFFTCTILYHPNLSNLVIFNENPFTVLIFIVILKGYNCEYFKPKILSCR